MSNGEGTMSMDMSQVHERIGKLRRESVALHESIVELWSAMEGMDARAQQWRDIVWDAARAAQDTTQRLSGR